MKICIKTNPGNWDTSQITVAGIRINGCIVNAAKCRITPSLLPPDIYAVWLGLKNMFIQQGDEDGARQCIYATAEKKSAEPVYALDGEGLEILIEPAREYLLIITHWEWADGRTTPPLAITLEDPDAIALTNYLTNPETYHLT